MKWINFLKDTNYQRSLREKQKTGITPYLPNKFYLSFQIFPRKKFQAKIASQVNFSKHLLKK